MHSNSRPFDARRPGDRSRVPGGRRRAAGFTLMEILIAVAIVGILTAIAVGSYRKQSLRANRTDGRTMLMQIQLAEQKFYLQNNTFTTDITDAPPTGLGMATTSPRGFYKLTVAGGTAGIATSFVVTATATGTQTQDDPNCLTYTVDDAGTRTPDDTATGCWH